MHCHKLNLVVSTVMQSDQEAAEDASALLVANRSGAVLGPHTILKEDHFPGCQSPKLPPAIPGAPNFRGVGV